MASPLSRPAHRGVSPLALLLFAAVIAALAIFPSFVKKPYVLHMGVMLFLAVIVRFGGLPAFRRARVRLQRVGHPAAAGTAAALPYRVSVKHG